MENMEHVKNIFFFVGSALGIVAFINSSINPLLEQNKKKWLEVEEILDDNFFQRLEFTVHQTRSVTEKQFSTLWFFLDEISQKKDYLQLKFPNKKIFDKHLKKLAKLIEELNEEVTPPIWNFHLRKNSEDLYRLENNYFKKEFTDHNQSTKEYLKHLHYATDLTIKMRIEFHALQAIANLQFVELPFKRIIINQAKSKYSDRLRDK